MKYLHLFVFIFIFQFGFAQMKEGYFLYNIEVKAIDTTLKTRQAVGLLQNSNMELYFSENNSRMNFKLGKISNISVIFNQNSKDVLTLNEGAMGKVAIIKPPVEKEDVDSKDSTLRLEYTDETKVILGYTCKKVILIQNGVSATYWYTNDVAVNLSQYQISNPHVPGFPMKFSKTDNGILMTFEIANIEDTVNKDDENLFSLTPPPGYRIISE